MVVSLAEAGVVGAGDGGLHLEADAVDGGEA